MRSQRLRKKAISATNWCRIDARRPKRFPGRWRVDPTIWPMSKKAFVSWRYRIEDGMWFDPKVSPLHHKVAVGLLRHYDREKGEFYISDEKLARWIRRDRGVLVGFRKRMTELGWIQYRPGGFRRGATTYIFSDARAAVVKNILLDEGIRRREEDRDLDCEGAADNAGEPQQSSTMLGKHNVVKTQQSKPHCWENEVMNVGVLQQLSPYTSRTDATGRRYGSPRTHARP